MERIKKVAMFILKVVVSIIMLGSVCLGGVMVWMLGSELFKDLPDPIIITLPKNAIVISGKNSEIRVPAENVTFEKIIAEKSASGSRLFVVYSNDKLDYWLFGDAILHHQRTFDNLWKEDHILIKNIGLSGNYTIVYPGKDIVGVIFMFLFFGAFFIVLPAHGICDIWHRKKTCGKENCK